MRYLPALSVICLTLGLGSVAMAQSRYSYLHETTNEILQIQRSTVKLTPGESARIANRVCKTLEALLRDRGFKDDVYKLAELSRKQSDFHQQLADNLVFFLDAFVPDEASVLRKSNLSPDATTQMLAAASALRESLRTPLSPEQLMNNLIGLRNEACRAVETLAKEQDDEKSSQQRWKRIRRWGLGLGGLSLVAADAVAAVPTSGIATASFTLGGAAVTAALAQ
ncbi:MAG TPA: hypothetical protein VK676_07075 [Steroidobacteraceae bacterium]|jgi:hypothetical protein|nr:hypothetical protein [Steroidobacteraceae bacterium]